MLIACRPVRDAQQTVATADSLRVNHGVAYDDSLALADAYATLGSWRLIYPDDYARACYYYGYMLRQHGDQVAAMRAFIAGTHAPYIQRVIPLPWFSNYHILGRIYTNMGVMCHLADDFELGFAMYEQSAKSFYRAGDTTLYYYGLNAMALELAEQKLHDETLALLDSIEQNCTDNGVLSKLWETKAILYYNLGQYDSTIYSSQELYSRGYKAATGYVKEAQAYWHLERYDSALYYAKLVVDHPCASAQDKYHVLYILISHDSINSTQEVQTLSAERADLNSEHIEPLLQQLSVATELLRQSLDKKSSLVNLAWLMAAICLIGGCTWSASAWIKKQHTLLRRATLLEQEKLRQQHQNMQEKYLSLQQLQEAHQQELVNAIEDTCKCLRESEHMEADLHWKDYNQMCDLCNDHFHLLITKLHAIAKLSEKETRLCVLVLIGINSRAETAAHLRYSLTGIGKLKDTTAKKLGTTGSELRHFLVLLASKN
jgi:hypothetical protein